MNKSTASRTIGTISIVLILCGLAFNPWLVGLVFSASGRIDSPVWMVCIVFVELVFLASGMLIWVRRERVSLAGILYAAAIAVITIIALEAALRIESRYFYPHRYMITRDRAGLSFFRDKPWSEELFREFEGIRLRLDPYAGWRGEEYHNKYLTIDNGGFRQTVLPKPTAGFRDTVLLLGGSTMWGWYVRDEATIPSLVAARLADAGRPSFVLNCGEKGHTMTQQLMRLTSLLRQGWRPKDVIVYFGINEIQGAYKADSVGAIDFTEEMNDVVKLYRQTYFRQLGMVTREYVQRNLMLFRLADRVVSKVSSYTTFPVGRTISDERMAVLAEGLAGDLRANYDLLERLSVSYGFRFACILQPTIFTRSFRTDEEKVCDRDADDETLRRLFLRTYDRFREMRLPKLHDYSDIFNGVPGSVYMDLCHVSEEANKIIAGKMTALLLDPGGAPAQ